MGAYYWKLMVTGLFPGAVAIMHAMDGNEAQAIGWLQGGIIYMTFGLLMGILVLPRLEGPVPEPTNTQEDS
jgi:hypothetical protein